MVCACIQVFLLVCRGRMFLLTHIYFALMVLIKLFYNTSEVVKSAVLVVSSPG